MNEWRQCKRKEITRIRLLKIIVWKKKMLYCHAYGICLCIQLQLTNDNNSKTRSVQERWIKTKITSPYQNQRNEDILERISLVVLTLLKHTYVRWTYQSLLWMWIKWKNVRKEVKRKCVRKNSKRSRYKNLRLFVCVYWLLWIL